MPDFRPDLRPDIMPELKPYFIPDFMPDSIPNFMPDFIPQFMSDFMSDIMPDFMLDIMPDFMPYGYDCLVYFNVNITEVRLAEDGLGMLIFSNETVFLNFGFFGNKYCRYLSIYARLNELIFG